MTELQDLHRSTMQADVEADAARDTFRAAIRAAHETGRSYNSLAAELGLHRSRVAQLCHPGAPARRALSTPPELETGAERELRLAREADAGRTE